MLFRSMRCHLHSGEVLAVVVSYNGGEKTRKTVSSLCGQVGHILIVDNASDVESVSILRHLEEHRKISVVWLQENKGIGYALNVGVQTAREKNFQWLLTMDQDSVVDDSIIEAFRAALDRKPGIMCLAPSVVINGGKEKPADRVVEYAMTSGNLVNVKLFDKIGLYDEAMFIDGIDFDFCLRVRKAGYEIYQVRNAFMEHELGDAESTPSFLARVYTSHSALRRYYLFRNHTYLLRSYWGAFPLLLLKLSVGNLILLLLIPFFDKKPLTSLSFAMRGIIHSFLGKTGAYWEGV